MPQDSQTLPRKGARPSYGILSKFVHLAGAQWIHDGLHTFFLIYLARLSTSDYGEFMVAFGLASIILFLGEFGLNQPLVASLSKKYSHKGDILAQYTMLKSILLVTGWLGVVVFIFWQGYTPGLKNLVMVISAGVGLEAIASSFFIAIRVEGRQDLEGRIRVVSGVFGYGYAIALLSLGAAPHWIALFKLIENVCNITGGVWMALKTTEFSGLALKRKSLARTWATAKNGTVFVLMALAAILYNKANLYFLQSQGGPTKVAQYSVTWELVDGISILVSNLLLSSILYPLFVRLWKNDKREFNRLASNSVRWLIGASLPIMFVLFVESDRLIGLIYGGAYFDAMWMQKWLVGTILCGFVHNLAAYLMMSQGKQRMLLFIYMGGLALNLTLCATLIPASPLLGTCLAMLITKAAVAVTTTTYCQMTMRIIDLKSLWRILVASLCAAGLYAATYRIGIREIPEILALVPFGFLAYRWKQELKAQRVQMGLT
ncbi:polysaccharide biosynthesis protein [Solidesulfovibrio carbinoliphilus subsp. oakridgensis]|uniref:Polysaccharide biosynthesis protein n=1 Tax=Solidesulfovibrio carbinoliphilus subsp. oakridgensis TaxID=694327 RepID=G7Q6V4_9BACT|nr:oligosaccharide flippase family protein [Solidesulfovibrio carbinoliphilus]EHJ48039.1 polysaccharide biosynthesis protein [Solidesulfovibrio carbinoliphilus subsp. oakridgensis]